jgi:LmbE family N-acetylglucosaminyl deacetylase
MSRKVCLSFLAHPDDAEILCVGTMIRLREEYGYELHLATATAGDLGSMDNGPAEISAIRTAENRRSAELIGATYHCLGERDSKVVYDAATIQKAGELFRKIAPTLVFTHPRHDYMLDHEQAHLLARNASFIFPAPNFSSLPRHPDSHVPHLYYVDPVGAHDHAGRLVTPTTVIDITSVQDKKLAALACHASQRDWLRAHHGMDEYLEATKRHAADRGTLIGKPAAEAFVQHRGHAYPANDLLSELFGSLSREGRGLG